jgi:hypothetical protein
MVMLMNPDEKARRLDKPGPEVFGRDPGKKRLAVLGKSDWRGRRAAVQQPARQSDSFGKVAVQKLANSEKPTRIGILV